MTIWTTRPESPEDIDAIRAVNRAAFPTSAEAEIVDALRADPEAWIPSLSIVAVDDSGRVVAHALFSRCRVGSEPALVLGPCAVLPEVQRQCAGSAAIRAGLEAARAMGEGLVVVLGHPAFYPRFGFAPASRWGIVPPFEVPHDVIMALPLDPDRPAPSGIIVYPPAFGV
jgi:predicted N-acetyltransferase YhbS